MPLPSFPTAIFKVSGKTSKSSRNDISTFPIPHQNILRRIQSSDSLVAASDVSESSRYSLESSFEEEIFVGRGISTVKADWQISKADTMSAASPKGEMSDSAYNFDKPWNCGSDDARKDPCDYSKDDAVYPRIRLDPAKCFLKPGDDVSEEAVSHTLRGGHLETDEADMFVIDSDSEVFEDDYAQGSQKRKLSQWFGPSSSKPKSDKSRSGFGLGLFWKSSTAEQSACLFDQEKEIKGLRYQNKSFAVTTPTKLDSVKAMERLNASLPGVKLRCAHQKN